MAGVDLDGVAEGVLGLGQEVVGLQRIAQDEPGLASIGRQLDGATRRGQGPVGHAQRDQRGGQPDQGVDVLGGGAQTAAERPHSPDVTAERLLGEGQAAPCPRRMGGISGRLREEVGRPLVATQHGKRAAAADHGIGVLGIEAERGAERRIGGLLVVAADQGDAEQVVRGRLERTTRDDAAQQGLGRLELPGAQQRHRLGDGAIVSCGRLFRRRRLSVHDLAPGGGASRRHPAAAGAWSARAGSRRCGSRARPGASRPQAPRRRTSPR